jgi:hypothetical protein
MTRDQFREYWMAAMKRDCPSQEEWTEYRAGTLPASSRKLFDQHLGGCPECRSLIEDMEAFYGDVAPEPSAPMEADLRKVLDRVAPRAAARRPWAWMGIAAALAVLVIGQAYWLNLLRTGRELERAEFRQRAADLEQRSVQAQQQVAELRRPSAGALLQDMAPRNQTVRSQEGRKPRSLRVSTRQPIVLILHGAANGAVAWQVEDASGKVVYEGRGAFGADGSLSLSLPPGSLASGTYRLSLPGGNGRRVMEPVIEVQEAARN